MNRLNMPGLALWVLLGPPCIAWAQAGDSPAAAPIDRQARAWAANCAACHGSNGLSRGGIPSIAGRAPDEALRAMLEFRADQRPASTVMHQHFKGYSEAELQRIARYFATLPAQ